MSGAAGTCLPTTQWYLYSEEDEPLGSRYTSAIPEVGATVEDAGELGTAEIVKVTELRATCAMRRFRVDVRKSG
ncbi:MAG: hypothetical protein CMO68_00710 [Verrucomicrobiales bacterium]|nr:hypothetical protein [Verrucomicrobiales bacterium]